MNENPDYNHLVPTGEYTGEIISWHIATLTTRPYILIVFQFKLSNEKNIFYSVPSWLSLAPIANYIGVEVPDYKRIPSTIIDKFIGKKVKLNVIIETTKNSPTVRHYNRIERVSKYKPYKGQIHNWMRVYLPSGHYRIAGEIEVEGRLNSRGIQSILTSNVVFFDAEKKQVETMDNIYSLIGEEQAAHLSPTSTGPR